MTDNVSFNELLTLISAIFEKGYGYSRDEAQITATVLVEADARGIASHGVSRLSFYRQNLDLGHAHPGLQPKIVWETPASLVLDGQGGLGCYIADLAVKKTIEKAKVTGVCYSSVRNSNHYGIAGYWAELIAKENMIGMAFTNTYIAGVATFGNLRILGTNPISVAIPEGDDRIFLLDMATTTVTHGKVELYDRRQKKMPQGWVVDEKGREVTDATAFEKNFYQTNLGGHLYIGGAGEESGGHKGFGLGLLVELLCSGLSLGRSSLQTYAKDGNAEITHFFSAIKLDLFGRPDELKSHMGEILKSVRASSKAEGQDRIYIHGEKEAEARAKSLKEGVFLDKATKDYLKKLCLTLDLPLIKGLDNDH
ncbi:MAG: Ldh family oxidoreductase [Deltaproteobacteria bacterium]|jgi:LDH2 family malate/lactate/ureidoglycolate dehydrogenase|nr:Ldh family oxidoreductase [Deltaproteobacteria bacterium]